MNVLKELEDFPEIFDTKFLIVPTLKASDSKVIHAGVAYTCPNESNFTSDERKVTNFLSDEFIDGNYDDFEFLSLNEFKAKETNFCSKCLKYTSYVNTKGETQTVESLIFSFETLKEFSEQPIENTFEFYELLTLTGAEFEGISKILLEDESLATTIINTFKNKFENKLNSVIETLKEEAFSNELQNAFYDKATNSLMDINSLSSPLASWFKAQKKSLEETLKDDKSVVLFENEITFNLLSTQILYSSEQEDFKQNLILLTQLKLLYMHGSNDFMALPYAIFLARAEILRAWFPTATKNPDRYVIVNSMPELQVLENCKALINYTNSTFDTYEKVYNVAVNV